MKSLKGTKTAENLMKSFAGECQANTRYTYYSEVAKKQGYIQISNVFTETAKQEMQHAKRFYNFLKDEYKGEDIQITGMYPAALYDDTAKNLEAAALGEHEEWSHSYPEFARVAREEGFMQVATAFDRISEVENRHESKYNKLLNSIKDGKVFKKDTSVLWKCNNCGYIYEGEEAPKACPACLHPQGYFEVFIDN